MYREIYKIYRHRYFLSQLCTTCAKNNTTTPARAHPHTARVLFLWVYDTNRGWRSLSYSFFLNFPTLVHSFNTVGASSGYI